MRWTSGSYPRARRSCRAVARSRRALRAERPVAEGLRRRGLGRRRREARGSATTPIPRRRGGENESKDRPVVRANFASLSSTLGDIARATHEALTRARYEPAGVVVRAGGVQGARRFPRRRAPRASPRGHDPTSMEAVVRRLNELPTHEGSSQDPEVGAARPAARGAHRGARGERRAGGWPARSRPPRPTPGRHYYRYFAVTG